MSVDQRLTVPNATGDLIVVVSSEVSIVEGVSKLNFDEIRLTVPLPVNINRQCEHVQIRRPREAIHIRYRSGDLPFEVELS